MKKNNFKRFVHSLVIMPVMAANVALPGGHNPEIAKNVLSQKFNIESIGFMTNNQAIDPEVALQEIRVQKAKAIDAYFEARNMPLKGMGMKMVQEAEKNDLDWRLIAAISVRESSGGKEMFAENNPVGWGNKVKFDSFDHAIETVSRNLGGNNPKTAHHYDNKTTIQILRAYNPPSIVRLYAEEVVSIMNTIGEPDTESKTLAVNA